MNFKTKITTLTVLAVMVLAVASAASFAAPSYMGYTGLIFTPTADTLNLSEFNLGAAFVSADNDNDVSFFTGNLGVASKFEAGATVIDTDGSDSNTIVNAKFRISPESLTMPAVAVGLSDVFDEVDSTPYIVLSKGFSWDTEAVDVPRFHVGIGGGRLDGLFGGISAAIGKQTIVMAEYDTDDLNFGAQFAISQELRLRADYVNEGDFGFGISFNKILY